MGDHIITVGDFDSADEVEAGVDFNPEGIEDDGKEYVMLMTPRGAFKNCIALPFKLLVGLIVAFFEKPLRVSLLLFVSGYMGLQTYYNESYLTSAFWVVLAGFCIGVAVSHLERGRR